MSSSLGAPHLRTLLAAGCAVAVLGSERFSLPAGAAQSQMLWQIGQPDHSIAEFALAPGDYARFLERFGSSDHAYYIGISQPQRDWPYVLPGPLDLWGSSHDEGRWDQMNTLPVGFVLQQAGQDGDCVLTLDLCDTHPQHPPRLRLTVNGAIFERDLPAGGSEGSLCGKLESAKACSVRFEFPGSLLRAGYNELALRLTRGDWLVFDALHLNAPSGVKLAPPSSIVVRSVSCAPYAVSSSSSTPATLRVELFCAEPAGKLGLRCENGKTSEWAVQPGLQVLEIPVPPSARGKTTPLGLYGNGRLLCQTQVRLEPSLRATPADYVDVFKGTAHSRWMIAPGPWMPFSMVKISPDNQTEGWCAGYDYGIESIDCFSHIHEWTMAGLGMMPTLGPLRTHPGLDGSGYSSRIDKATERGGIGYYQVLLKDSGIQVELAATTRASLQRYTFPAGDQARVLFSFLLPNEYPMKVLHARVRRSGPAELEGTIETDLPHVVYSGDQRFDLHFVSQFSRPFDQLGGWNGEQVLSSAREFSLSNACGVFAEFKTAAGEKVLVRTGISLVSTENARLNLEKELAKPFRWDFEAVVRHQREEWNCLLGRVEVETSDAREKSRFYSNLYRALSGRNTWSDVNGEWTDPQERRQKLVDADTVMLGGDAFWTTFWNLNQVMNLMAPEWSARWAKSELELYDKCGWLSKGPAGLEYISVMVAEHEIALLVGAYQHGLKGLDAEKMLAAAFKVQTTLPQDHPGGGRVGNEHLQSYLKHGYVAAGEGNPSNTYEYAYDDWCVAQLALALGRQDVAERFLKRSQNWRTNFDPVIGFARPRKPNGDWVSPFDPYRTPGFVEGNAWQYTWFVPQDVPSLVAALGQRRFIDRLNEGFEKSAPTRFNAAGDQMEDYPLNQGNQPTMHASWLFNWAGRPWMTQKWTRAILDSYYGFNPADAYLGDEDQGQMSAWFVMASIGLFQTDGGCRLHPIYELGSPLYPRTVLHFSRAYYGGKTLTIDAHNASRANCYIQSATFNGQPLNRWWLRQKELLEGGRLELEMGAQPNPNWAADCSLPD